jgi:protoporphyrinogen IX oxidase
MYLWIKAFHIIAVITWMAGQLYLPRLFVYHCETLPGSDGSERFKVMERRLLRGIVTPSMVVVWILGLSLLYLDPSLLSQGWMHAKLTLVVLMSAFHGLLVRWTKDFAADRNQRPARFYRLVNEAPAVVLVGIVILVVVRPF